MQTVIEVSSEIAAKVLGAYSGNMQSVERDFAVAIEPALQGIAISGENIAQVNHAKLIVERLVDLAKSGYDLSKQTSDYFSNSILQGQIDQVASYNPDLICISAKGREIRCKTQGQSRYIDAIRKHEITFGIGPAGTGKTFLAVAVAVNAFRANEVDRIILTRPAVEAGEKLGFLPGDLQMKVDPYMRPLYDALQELMGTDQYFKNLEKGLIEVSPLAYMRGRTLDNAFIILDEAQNTTPEQMKMFLTRLGFNSKVVVTGDLTQVDLLPNQQCGLKKIRPILQGVEGIKFVELNNADVVRNPLVQRIVAAYEQHDKLSRRRGERNTDKKQ